jgi:hypothetical protein
VNVTGDAQGVNVVAASSLHWKVEPGWFELKTNVATFVLRVGWGGALVPGPELIVVCGAARSSVKVFVAGDWSVPPTPTARTEKTYVPSVVNVYVLGLLQAVKPAVCPGPVSSHWNVEFALSAWKLNVGVASLKKHGSGQAAPLGPESMSVSGASVSTVNE